MVRDGGLSRVEGVGSNSPISYWWWKWKPFDLLLLLSPTTLWTHVRRVEAALCRRQTEADSQGIPGAPHTVLMAVDWEDRSSSRSLWAVGKIWRRKKKSLNEYWLQYIKRQCSYCVLFISVAQTKGVLRLGRLQAEVCSYTQQKSIFMTNLVNLST